jgi:hypothetical protein
MTSSKDKIKSNALFNTTFSSMSTKPYQCQHISLPNKQLTLVAELDDDSIELAKHFKVFDDVGVLVCD